MTSSKYAVNPVCDWRCGLSPRCFADLFSVQLQAVVGVDNGGDHRGTTDRSRSATQGRHVVDNSSRSTCRRLPDPRLLRPRRLSALDRRLEATALRLCDVRGARAVVLPVVVDRRRRRDDVDPAALHPACLHGRHHRLSHKISTLQNQRKSVLNAHVFV